MKKIILLPLFLTCASANAVPNIWELLVLQGYEQYSIQDSQERTLLISCAYDAGEDSDHSAIFIAKNKEYTNSQSKQPLTFLLDGKKSVTPPDSTNWHGGDRDWNNFTDGMSKAKKIDVYINNKKVTTFMPNKSSINEVARGMANCTGKLS